MKSLLRRLFVHAVVLTVTPSVFGNAFVIDPSLRVILGSALTATLLHLLIKPILKLLILPLSIATFGLATLLVHIALLYLLTLFTSIIINPWQFPGFVLGDIQLAPGMWSYLGTMLAISLFMALAHSLIMWLME